MSAPVDPDHPNRTCHTVSLIVAHHSSFLSSNTFQLDLKLAETDAAVITWWVNVNPPADALTTLDDCPSINPP